MGVSFYTSIEYNTYICLIKYMRLFTFGSHVRQRGYFYHLPTEEKAVSASHQKSTQDMSQPE